MNKLLFGNHLTVDIDIKNHKLGDNEIEEFLKNIKCVDGAGVINDDDKKSRIICKEKFLICRQLNENQNITAGDEQFELKNCKKLEELCVLETHHQKRQIDKKTYQCNICKASFNCSGSLKLHTRIHTGEKPYECEVCNKKFSHSSHLTDHQRIHTGEKPYECTFCDKKFAVSGNLKYHYRSKHSDKKLCPSNICNPVLKTFECNICNKKFNQSGHLKVHQRIHTGEKPYECIICHRKFVVSSHLKSHYRSRHSDESTNILSNNKGVPSLTTSVYLKVQSPVSIEEGTFECDVCNEKFRIHDHLNLHKQIHAAEEQYQSNICNKKLTASTYSDEKSYPTNISNPNCTSLRTFECNVCYKKFCQLAHLKVHQIIIHTGEKPYECAICNKKFTESSGLKSHLRSSHNDQKPYPSSISDFTLKTLVGAKMQQPIFMGASSFECEVCNKKFGQLGHLKDHLRLHTGEKPYECSLCNKKFAVSSNLNSHYRYKHPDVQQYKTNLSNSSLKTFECNFCNKKFRQSGHLKVHRRIHTGEKQYECDLCNKKFRNSGHLKGHRRIHTGEKPYECTICNKKFSASSNLKLHNISKHSDEKQYLISIIDPPFKKLVERKVHRPIDMGVKSFECNVCTKKFRHSGFLRVHQRIHTGEKPYQCRVCNKKFRLPCHLKYHQRIHTGEKIHECNVCQKKIAALSVLKSHVKRARADPALAPGGGHDIVKKVISKIWYLETKLFLKKKNGHFHIQGGGHEPQ